MITLMDINEKWASYWFDEYELYKYKDDLTGKYLTKTNVIHLGLAIMRWESNLNSGQVVWEPKVNGCSYGQYGLLSTTAKTKGWNGTDPIELLDPDKNAKYALSFLCEQLKKYDGNIDEALAAYNAGKARYNKHGVLRNQYYVENVYRLYIKLNRRIKWTKEDN